MDQVRRGVVHRAAECFAARNLRHHLGWTVIRYRFDFVLKVRDTTHARNDSRAN